MSSLCLLGADSLLGRHLLSLLLSPHPSLPFVVPHQIRLWTVAPFQAPPTPDSDCPSLLFLHGDHRLEEAIEGAETVINCQECADWSMVPDVERLQRENVDVPRRILSAISPTATLIHISSAFVQSWWRWPNINGKEQRAADYEKGWPFKEYCISKVASESIVLSREGRTLVVRVAALYGEGDNSSQVTDAIKISSLFSSTIPFVGDGGGCTQLSYAGNVAAGVLRAIPVAPLKVDDTSDLSRIVIIGDATPIVNTYTNVLPMVQNGKLRLSSYKIPFFLLFIPYFLFTLIVRLLSKAVDIPKAIRQLPDPSFFFVFFYHWTFFCSFKARIFLNHRDIYSQEECLARSSAYYRKLDPTDVKRYSWQAREYGSQGSIDN